MKAKWIWEDDWSGKVNVGIIKEGTLIPFKQSCCKLIPRHEIIVYEHAIGRFAIKMHIHTRWCEERLFDVNLPPRITTLECAKRQAPNIVRQQIAKALEEHTAKYKNILNII